LHYEAGYGSIYKYAHLKRLFAVFVGFRASTQPTEIGDRTNILPVAFFPDSLFIEQLNKLPIATNTIAKAQSSFMNEFTNGTTASEIDIFKDYSDAFHSIKISFPQIRTTEISTTENTVGEISSEANGIAKITVHKESVGKVDVTKVRSSKIATIQTVALGNTFSEIRNGWTNVTQIQPTKISLPSSVSSQQLFSSNISHNPTSLLVTSINNSATNIW
jgi:hypothetical protein